MGECPFGMRAGTDGRTLEPQPDEQAIIDAVLELRADGLSLRRIATKLRERNVVSPRSGRALSSTQVHRIVRRHESEAA